MAWESEVWRRYVAQYEAEASRAREKTMTYAPIRLSVGNNPDGGLIFAMIDPLADEPKKRAERDRDAIANDKAEEALFRARLYRDAGFPDNCAKRGLFSMLSEPQDAFVGVERKPLTKSYLAQFGADVKANKRRSMIFCGNVGTGKTRIAASVAQGLCMNGMKCRYVLMPDLLERLRKATSFKSDKSAHAIIQEVFNARFIVLDELGRTIGRDNAGLLFEVFDALWTGGYSWIATSNIDAQKVVNTLDAAILDRIRDGGEIVSFEGQSMRAREAA